jgi:hypothetical protein
VQALVQLAVVEVAAAGIAAAGNLVAADILDIGHLSSLSATITRIFSQCHPHGGYIIP